MQATEGPVCFNGKCNNLSTQKKKKKKSHNLENIEKNSQKESKFSMELIFR